MNSAIVAICLSQIITFSETRITHLVKYLADDAAMPQFSAYFWKFVKKKNVYTRVYKNRPGRRERSVQAYDSQRSTPARLVIIRPGLAGVDCHRSRGEERRTRR